MKRLILFLSMVLIIVISARADVIGVDGLYFNRGESDVVTLTTPPTGVYSGKIHIPHEVSYGGQTYEVSYNLSSALSNSDITELSFSDGFKYLGPAKIIECSNLKRISVPNVEREQFAFSFCDNALCAVVKDDGENLRIKAEIFNIYDTSGKKLEPYLVNKYDRSRLYAEKDGYITVPARETAASYLGILKVSGYYAVEFYVDIDGNDVLVRTDASYWKSGDKVIVDGIRYDILGDGSGACVSRDIVDCNYTGDIRIASTVNYNGRDYPVTVIDQYAFMNTDIRSVTMPSTLKYIGYNKINEYDRDDVCYSCAFSGCANLTTVNLNEGLERVAQYSFENCNSLKSIKLPNSLKRIGSGTFSGCESLSSINIPENVEDVWSTDSWFRNCTSLEQIEIPDNIWNLGRNMFAGCTNLKTVKLGKGLQSIGDRCFAGCEALEDFVIPNNVVCDNPFTDNSRYCSFEIVENEDEYIRIKVTNNIRSIDNNRQPSIVASNICLYSYWYDNELQSYKFEKTKEFFEWPADPYIVSIALGHREYITVDNNNKTHYGFLLIEPRSYSGITGTLARFDLTPDKTSGIEDVIVDGDSSTIECNGPVSIYDLQGMQRYHGERDAMPTLPRGIYIIRYTNGKAEKVML